MKTYTENNTLYVEGVRDFDVDHIFDCGQCFRWEKTESGSYAGVAFGRIAEVSYDCDKETLVIKGADEEDFENIWRGYFDLDRDYGEIKKILSMRDDVICSAIEYGSGIRILNQEKWETLISFIISQNNNIPRIKKCIDTLAKTLGEKVGEYKGKEYYSLPSPRILAEGGVEALQPCRLGYRAPYLVKTACKVAEEGLESLEALGDEAMKSSETVEKLREYCGVGPKVANCISLFSMGKTDSFPIDVWVKKVMNRLYGIDEADTGKMAEFAADTFGEYGGIAQQYLFYYITHNREAGL